MAGRVDDQTVRLLGLSSMVIGTTLLYFVR